MNLDFTKICRLCLRNCNDFIDLSQNNGARSLSPELTKTINFCYGLQIDVTDNLPTKVCLQCVQVLSLFYTTKNNVMASEQLLKNILSVRNNYESNKAESFLNPLSENSYSLIELEDKKTINTSDIEGEAKSFNNIVKDSNNFKFSKFFNIFNDSSQLNQGSNLFCTDEKSSGELNPITTNIKNKGNEGIEELSLKGVDEIPSGERNLDFVLKPMNIYKLNHSTDAVKVHPDSYQEDKMNKTEEPKGKKIRKPTRRSTTRGFKEIGTVIDETNILWHSKRSKLRFLKSKLEEK